MTARVSMLLKARASPDMLPFSLCNKKRLEIGHMNRPIFPMTLSIPSYDIGKQVGLRTYLQALVCVCLYSNNEPVPKTFTPLHYTCRHFTYTHLNFKLADAWLRRFIMQIGQCDWKRLAFITNSIRVKWETWNLISKREGSLKSDSNPIYE